MGLAVFCGLEGPGILHMLNDKVWRYRMMSLATLQSPSIVAQQLDFELAKIEMSCEGEDRVENRATVRTP